MNDDEFHIFDEEIERISEQLIDFCSDVIDRLTIEDLISLKKHLNQVQSSTLIESIDEIMTISRKLAVLARILELENL